MEEKEMGHNPIITRGFKPRKTRYKSLIINNQCSLKLGVLIYILTRDIYALPQVQKAFSFYVAGDENILRKNILS